MSAKGRGQIAEQILALAREHDVALRADPDLVELLARVPLGDEIPRELYLAVAQVLAFVYALSERSPPPRGGRASTRIETEP